MIYLIYIAEDFLFNLNLSRNGKLKKIFTITFIFFLTTSIAYCQEFKQPLQLTITSDKPVYEVREAINIQFVFKNISRDPIEFFVFDADLPIYHEFEFSDMSGGRIAYTSPQIDFTKRTTKQEKILPGGSVVTQVPLSKWKIAGLGHDYTAVGNEARKIIIKGIYFFPDGFQMVMKDGVKGFFGRLVSDPITIEVVEKNKPATCMEKAKSISIGMKRKDLEKFMTRDGGITAIDNERFFVQGCT